MERMDPAAGADAENAPSPDAPPAGATPVDAESVGAAVADAHRREWAFVLAATVRVTRDIDLAEECVQDAYTRALDTWGDSGIPASPGAWLTTVARRRALDLKRRDETARRALPLLVMDRAGQAGVAGHDGQMGPGAPADPAGRAGPAGTAIADDRLRLVFTCCHPTLSTDAQVALSLRLLCGLSTAEVARAFLVSEPTMAARITRAKKKIATAGIPYRVPPAAELPARVDAVLTVIHLLFSTGHTAPSGATLVRGDLVERALDLARMLHVLLPGNGEVAGLTALILLTDARRDARVGPDGRLVLLPDQDRGRWDRARIAEGAALVRGALRQAPPGRFTLMAAIAAVHDEAPRFGDTDWRQIVSLYDLLMRRWPSPVVALNRAAAIGFADGPAEGLAALDTLADCPELAAYGYLSAARADFLRRLGRTGEARLAYTEALMLTTNEIERDFLATRLEQC